MTFKDPYNNNHKKEDAIITRNTNKEEIFVDEHEYRRPSNRIAETYNSNQRETFGNKHYYANNNQQKNKPPSEYSGTKTYNNVSVSVNSERSKKHSKMLTNNSHRKKYAEENFLENERMNVNNNRTERE
jgi:hypothetical protein